MTNKPKKVLFICRGNWFRSQMAAAIYNKLTHSKTADSVGTYTGAPDEPEGQILANLFTTPHFFETMEKNGMHVRNNSTKRLQPSMIDEYDTVISMAEEPYIPEFLKKAEKVIWWKVENPTFVDQKIAEDTYEKIEKLVKDLVTKTFQSPKNVLE
jgi:protein-tyrosine-phosphatase